MRVFGTGEACLVYQSGQEIGLVQERLVCVFRGCLVSETACSAHERVFRGGLVSETVRSAHGRVCRGCLVSEKPHSAHEKVSQGCLVSGTAHSAHGEGLLQ